MTLKECVLEAAKNMDIVREFDIEIRDGKTWENHGPGDATEFVKFVYERIWMKLPKDMRDE